MQQYILTDEEYGKVLDTIVVACVDVAVLCGSKILLEKRAQEPIKHEFWLIGGRMLVGEDLSQAAQRGITQELGLNIALDRFTEIGAYNLRWPRRREPMPENGCHQFMIAHAVHLTTDEKLAFDTTHNTRYEWLNITEITEDSVVPELYTILSKLKRKVENYV